MQKTQHTTHTHRLTPTPPSVCMIMNAKTHYVTSFNIHSY